MKYKELIRVANYVYRKETGNPPSGLSIKDMATVLQNSPVTKKDAWLYFKQKLADLKKAGPLPKEVLPKLKRTKIDKIKSDAFLKSGPWMRVRYQALVKHGGRCQCCGTSAKDGAVLHVDHIKPRSKYPELATDIDNLQVLCSLCNIGKSNRDETDWR